MAGAVNGVNSSHLDIDRDSFTLKERYERRDGDVLLTGVQAVVRVLVDQLRADRSRGVKTAAFVSGYPGSPLGGFDLALQRMDKSQLNIQHVSGLNEELAATAVWGSQQNHLAPLKDLDGVIGMWYGKTPGLDRCGDALRHANLHGAGANGGVVLAIGDDPSSKSSTLPGSCEHALLDLAIPIFSPGNVQEVIDLGRYAFELSRATGLYAGLKIVTAVADGFGIARVDSHRRLITNRQFRIDDTVWSFAQRPRFFIPDTLEMEKELYERRFPAAIQFIAANDINHITVSSPADTIGIVSSGRTYVELRQALTEVGLNDRELSSRGIRLLQLSVPYPLEPGIIDRFVRGLTRVIVVEEKRSFIERQIRDLLYDHHERPLIEGKRDATGMLLFPQDNDLTADRLRPLIVRALGFSDLAARQKSRIPFSTGSLERVEAATRTPYFCSGCPHNRSTQDVTGSPVGGGVGCHAMVMLMDRGVTSYTQMGGEGAQWIGRAPFVEAPHFVQNMGDGTYFHSGCLVPRFANAAGVNITFKLLFNGVIAMTGGQDPTGQVAIPELCGTLLLEGVTQIIVIADDMSRYKWPARLWQIPRSVKVWDRSRLNEAEVALSKIKGVTVLIYDQACANELRRLRKRKLVPERKTRVIINEAVCEGCGDCGAKSTCLSVHPVETLLGRKTQIHQASCNTDYSCLDGDCPSFVTVDILPHADANFTDIDLPVDIANPTLPTIPIDGYGVFTVGIGGTGLVTLNQILATAAAFDGLHVVGLDQTGLAQKGGPVVSHIKITDTAQSLASGISERSSDLLIALDMLVANEPQHRARLNPRRTKAVLSSSVVATSSMIIDTTEEFGNTEQIIDSLRECVMPGGALVEDFVSLSEHVFSDHMPANLIALGAAYQFGVLPISRESIESAITVNGAAVERSLLAFRLGRLVVADPQLIERRFSLSRPGSMDPSPSQSAKVRAQELVAEYLPPGTDLALINFVALLAAELIDYQNFSLAERYVTILASLIRRELMVAPDVSTLSRAAALHLFRLMAYKDEYEVARLHLIPRFQADIGRMVPSNHNKRYLLQPPVLKFFGLKRKIRLRRFLAHPTFHVLRAMKVVRGTPFDPFGHADMRKLERSLVEEYCAQIANTTELLTSDNLAAALRILEAPQLIRGFESVKRDSLERYCAERDAALAAFELVSV
jgi:indolepyruvate ferredoxin oxidoreductase